MAHAWQLNIGMGFLGLPCYGQIKYEKRWALLFTWLIAPATVVRLVIIANSDRGLLSILEAWGITIVVGSSLYLVAWAWGVVDAWRRADLLDPFARQSAEKGEGRLEPESRKRNGSQATALRPLEKQ